MLQYRQVNELRGVGEGLSSSVASAPSHLRRLSTNVQHLSAMSRWVIASPAVMSVSLFCQSCLPCLVWRYYRACQNLSGTGFIKIHPSVQDVPARVTGRCTKELVLINAHAPDRSQ